MADHPQLRRHHPLTRLGELAGSLLTQEQSRTQRRNRNNRRPVQDPGQFAGVFRIAYRFRTDCVDWPDEPLVVEGSIVDVQKVVQPYPRQPLPAGGQPTAEAGREERAQQAQRPPCGRLDNSGPHRHHPQPGVGCGHGRRLPVSDHVGEKSVAAAAVFSQQRVAAVKPIESDCRGADEHARPVLGGRGRFRQQAGWSDAAVPDCRPVPVGEATGDRSAGQVHHRIDVVEQAISGSLRIPRPLVAPARGPSHQPDHPVPTGGQERAEC